MRTLFIFFLFTFFAIQSSAQYLHMPGEINLILKESQLSYVFDTLKEEITLKEQVVRSNFPEVIIPDSFQFEATSDYETSAEYEKYRIKAQKFAEKRKYVRAIDNYLAALEAANPKDLWTQSLVFRNISSCYLQQNDLGNTEIWLIKGLKTNVTPAFFYKELAAVYQLMGEKEEALRAITKAYLFNTKDEATEETILEYYALNHLQLNDWNLIPQFKLAKDENGAIRIFTKEKPWKAYAACKAVWRNEPGYAEDMNNLSTEDETLIEEKECLLNALLAWESLETGKEQFPALETLSRALPKHMVNTYLLYETQLRVTPDLIYTLTPQEVEEVVAYFIQIRARKIPAEQ